MRNFLAEIQTTIAPFDGGNHFLRSEFNLLYFSTDIVCQSALREDQQAMLMKSINESIIDKQLSGKFLTIMAPTGVGKTYCIATIIKSSLSKLDDKYVHVIVTPDTVAQRAAEDECIDKGIKCINVVTDLRDEQEFISKIELCRGQPTAIFASQGSLLNRTSWFKNAYEKKGYVYIVYRDEAHHGAHSAEDSKDATGAYRTQYSWMKALHSFRKDMSKDNRVFFLTGTPTNAHMDTGLAKDRRFFKPIFLCSPSLEVEISAELNICKDSDEAMRKSLERSKECEAIVAKLYEKTGDERWANNSTPSTLVFSALRGSRFTPNQSKTFNSKESEEWCIRNKIDPAKRDKDNGDSRIFRMFCEGRGITHCLFVRLGYTAMSLKNPISIVNHNDTKFNPKDRTGREIINQFLQMFGRLTRPAFWRTWKEAIHYIRKWKHNPEVYELLMQLICKFAFHKSVFVVRDSIGRAQTAFNVFKMGRIDNMPKFFELVQEYYDHHLVKNDYRSDQIVNHVRELVRECPISKISRFQICHIIPNADIANGLVKYEENVGNYIPLTDTIHKMFDDKLFYLEYEGDDLRIHFAPNLLECDKSDLHHAGVVDGAKVLLPYKLSEESIEYRKRMVIGNDKHK